MTTLPRMFSIGLVLSAGGALGDPWHSGVLSRLEELSGWDARTSDLIVGTSAGSFTGASLRAGLSSADSAARHQGLPLSVEGQALIDLITTRYEETKEPRDWRPWSPRMSARAMWPPWKLDPVRIALGGLPRGNISGAAIASRVDEMNPHGWPEAPLWIVTVRSDDGRRVVFGRDDVNGSLGQATQASSAIPIVYAPVRIGKREYIDGAVHSSTNADLVATLGFDLVIVSSVMTAKAETRNWITDPRRAWFGTKLDDEVNKIHGRGAAVVVIEPDASTLGELVAADPEARLRALHAGREAVDRTLAGQRGSGIRSLIDRATN